MSINHIIKDTVPEGEALDVKFKSVEAEDVKLNGGSQLSLNTYHMNSIADKVTGADLAYKSLFNDDSQNGTRYFSNINRFRFIDVDIRGTVKNESATSLGLLFQLYIGDYLLLQTDLIVWNSVSGERNFILKAKIDAKPSALRMYFDWNVPNLTTPISVASFNNFIVNPPDFTTPSPIDVRLKIDNGTILDTVESTYGTITIT